MSVVRCVCVFSSATATPVWRVSVATKARGAPFGSSLLGHARIAATAATWIEIVCAGGGGGGGAAAAAAAGAVVAGAGAVVVVGDVERVWVVVHVCVCLGLGDDGPHSVQHPLPMVGQMVTPRHPVHLVEEEEEEEEEGEEEEDETTHSLSLSPSLAYQYFLEFVPTRPGGADRVPCRVRGVGSVLAQMHNAPRQVHPTGRLLQRAKLPELTIIIDRRSCQLLLLFAAPPPATAPARATSPLPVASCRKQGN